MLSNAWNERQHFCEKRNPVAIGSRQPARLYISVSPGDPDVVAISRYNGSVVILSDGVQLPNAVNSPFTTMEALAFGDDADLYAFDNETTGYGFYRLKVDSSGVTLTDSQSRLIYGFFADIVDDSGLVYSSNGAVVDPIEDTLAGTFTGASSALSVALDDAAGRAYFLTYDVISSTSTILAYDKNSLVFLGAQQVPVVQGDRPGLGKQSYDLINYDAGFAYVVAGGQIVFTNPTFSAPVDQGLSHMPANHLVYDALRQKIYASVPGNGGAHGNTITVINPSAGTIETSIPIGSEPGVLAMSKDNNDLYVGLQGAAFVKRVNLNTQQVDLQFGLGADSFLGPKFAQDISAMPGNADTVAVAKMFETIIPPAAGVSIFNKGVELENTLSSRQQSNSLAFSDSPSLLYGFENDQTSYNFNRMEVDANGVTLTDATGGLIAGVAGILFDGGLVYSTVGTVVNPANNTAVNSFPGVGVADAAVVDDSLGRVFFLTYDASSKNVNVMAFDRNTYQLIGSTTVTGATVEGTDLVRWGKNGLAVSTSNEVVLIPNSPLTQ